MEAVRRRSSPASGRKDSMNETPKASTAHELVEAILFAMCSEVKQMKDGTIEIHCKRGLWSVCGRNPHDVEFEAYHYWKQYFHDGEYKDIVANAEIGHGGTPLASSDGSPSERPERATGRRSLHAAVICRHCVHWQGGFKPKDDNLEYAFCELTNIPPAPGIRGGSVEHPIETHCAFGCNLGKEDNG